MSDPTHVFSRRDFLRGITAAALMSSAAGAETCRAKP